MKDLFYFASILTASVSIATPVATPAKFKSTFKPTQSKGVAVKPAFKHSAIASTTSTPSTVASSPVKKPAANKNLLAGPTTPQTQVSVPSSQSLVTNQNVSTVKKPITLTQKAAEQKNYSGQVALSQSTNAVDFKDGSRSDSTELALVYAYQFSAMKFGVLFISDYDFQKKETTVTDPQFTGTFSPFNPKGFIVTTPYLITTAPLSEDSKKQELLGGVGAGLKLSLQPELFIKEFSISGSISVTRNIHRYTTALNGKFNNQYSSTQKLVVDYNPGHFDFSFTFYNLNGLSYDNSLKQKFIHAEEMAYAVTEAFSVSVGHANSGPGLKPNQVDSNIEFFNENSSQVYAGVSYAY